MDLREGHKEPTNNNLRRSLSYTSRPEDFLVSLRQSLDESVQQIFCKVNQDCFMSTFCCSNYSCTHPTVCLHGLKMQEDFCDFGFECSSRCCVEKMCSHPMMCYERCLSNRDCSATGACCSDGHCTQKIVCMGNKATGDYCDDDSECISGYCNLENSSSSPDIYN